MKNIDTEQVAAKEATTSANAEFAKIIWPKAGPLWLETATVIIVAAAIAIIISALDFGLRVGIEALMNL